MLFEEKFIESLRDDPISGAQEICNITFEYLATVNSNEWHLNEYEALIEAYALICELIESDLISYRENRPEISGDINSDCNNVRNFLSTLLQVLTSHKSIMKFNQMKSHFKTSLGGGFCYEFSQGDLDKIQDLINQLRSEISSSKQFEKEHQQRLLRRLEKIQSELHKKVSDLDRFWGLIGDAGVVLGKIGTDAKPLVDRIKDIASIVWQTQSRAEELPSGTPIPLLENTTNDIQRT